MDTTQNAICYWLPFQCSNQSECFQLSWSVYTMRNVIWNMEGKKASIKMLLLFFFFLSKSSLKLLFSTRSKNSVAFCGLLQHLVA